MVTGGGKEFGAIGRAAIGEDGLDGDAMGAVKSQGLLESVQNAGDFFIGEQTGKSEAGMIINGDVKRLDPCAWVAVGAVAGGPDAGLGKAAKLFNIKMKQLAGMSAFVTDDRGLWRVECGEPIETVALEDAGKGSFRDGQDHQDLSVGTALFAERDDLSFKLGGSLAWLMQRCRRAVFQALREAGSVSALEPLADSFLRDGESGGGAAPGEA